MAEQCPLMCGVYKLRLGSDESTAVIRLHPDDVAGETIPHGPHKGEPIGPGCYQAGSEAIEHFRPKITARLRKTPLVNDNGHAVCVDPTLVHKDGQIVAADPTPVMTLAADQHAYGNMLL